MNMGMDDETRDQENEGQPAQPAESTQPDELDQAFPPMSLIDFAPYDEDEEDEDDDYEHHHEFVLLDTEDLDQARRTARAILSAMEALALQMVQPQDRPEKSKDRDKDKEAGRAERQGYLQAKDIDRHMEQLSAALNSVAELIEIYAGIFEHD